MPKGKSSLKTAWNDKMDNYLKENFHKKTNQELADGIGLKISVTRVRLKELGLIRFNKKMWTDEQKKYLIENYKFTGNRELLLGLSERWPREEGWAQGQIDKQFIILNLKRTPKEIEAIIKKQIDKSVFGQNTVELSDKYVACLLSRGNKNMSTEDYLKHPNLIKLKRAQLLLNRAIKKQKNGKDNRTDKGRGSEGIEV